MHTTNLRSFLWFVTGVALTVTSVATFGALGANAGGPSTVDSTFVPITPCRLFDTRPGTDNVGTRNTPIGQTNVTMQVTGTNGDCTIPSDATAVAMNLTAVAPTADSFLQAFPADVARPPRGSNLNFTAGQSPVPNKVDVKLGIAGDIKLYNNTGTVDALADIVGYYTSSTISQLSADVASLQSQIGALNEDVVSLLEDTNVIPSGVTVSGYDQWDFTSVKDNQDVFITIQLPGLAPQKPAYGMGDSPIAATVDPACTGTAQLPTAPAGKVCVYVNDNERTDRVGVQPTTGSLFMDLGAFLVSFSIDDPSPSNDAYLDISWAYTAP